MNAFLNILQTPFSVWAKFINLDFQFEYSFQKSLK